MKGKYITKQILLACRKKRQHLKEDIYTQLQETIAERKKLLQQWEKLFMPKPKVVQKDIHEQLAETIAEYKKMKQKINKRLFSQVQETRSIITEKKAA